jgi:hypothetical protein
MCTETLPPTSAARWTKRTHQPLKRRRNEIANQTQSALPLMSRSQPNAPNAHPNRPPLPELQSNPFRPLIRSAVTLNQTNPRAPKPATPTRIANRTHSGRSSAPPPRSTKRTHGRPKPVGATKLQIKANRLCPSGPALNRTNPGRAGTPIAARNACFVVCGIPRLLASPPSPNHYFCGT